MPSKTRRIVHRNRPRLRGSGWVIIPLTMGSRYCADGLLLLALFASPLIAQSNPGEPIRPEWCRELPRPQYKKFDRVDVASDWFEVYRITHGVFAIYEPHQFEEVISYLIIGNKRALLFDTGLGIGRISDVTAKLTKLPVIVVNSHTHPDHIGGNAEFSEIYDEDTPFTRLHEQGNWKEFARDAVRPERICGKLPVAFDTAAYHSRPFHVTHRLKDGEQIDLGDRELEVIFTAGHTPDALCLLDRANGMLFTGDTYYPGPIYLFMPETDWAAYSASVARLAALQSKLKLLLPAHNVPTADPEDLLRLKQAVGDLNAGRVKPAVRDRQREYNFNGFSLLLADK